MSRPRSIILRCLLASLLGAAGLFAPASAAEPRAKARVKVYVDAPGVYALAVDDVAEILSGSAGGPLPALNLSHRGRPLPLWRVADDETGDRLVFLVPADHFAAPWRLDGSAMIVLLLAPGEPGGATPFSSSSRLDPDPDAGESLPPGVARLERVRRFEQDLSRAPLDHDAAAAGVDSMWFWTMISHQASSVHEIGLGDLADRALDGEAEMRIAVDFLGWSDPRLPDGVADHRVDLALDGETIGEASWDGRREHAVELAVPSSLLSAPARSPSTGPRLTLKIPRRHLEANEIVDLVYVDRVEVRYRVDRHLADGDAPLRLAPAAHRRWLPAPDASAEAVAVSSVGWYLERDPRAGWVLPATAKDEVALELWVVEPGQVRTPIAIEPTTPGARHLPPGLDYLMIAPRSLIAGTERLADFHRRRGLRVAVVDVVAIYDAFGDGEKSPRAIRRFLDDQLQASPGLRYVLLVGDADWLLTGDTTPYLDPSPERRDRVPTFVAASAYGPAASDHFYAADPVDPASPRFAIGRLPVVAADELEAMVDKILGHAAAPKAAGAETLLMLSDWTRPSLRRREKLSERSADAGFDLRRPEEAADRARDEQVIEALDRGPTVVYFGGHGSRHQWQLGEETVAGPETYFDREDVARLAPSRRGPVVVSISCATAPFDHPAADSLGEVMLLAPDRGAIAFLGAGVRLFTPRVFSEELVRALAREATVGEAVAAAKRAAGQPHVSELYNLLGDPALPLR